MVSAEYNAFFGIELNWSGMVYIYESIYALGQTHSTWILYKTRRWKTLFTLHTNTHTNTSILGVHVCASECKRECEFVVEFSSTNETRVMRCQNLTVSSRFLKCRTQSPKLQIRDLCSPISRVVTDRVYQLSQVLSQRHLRFRIVNKAQLPKNLIRISIQPATIR